MGFTMHMAWRVGAAGHGIECLTFLKDDAQLIVKQSLKYSYSTLLCNTARQLRPGLMETANTAALRLLPACCHRLRRGSTLPQPHGARLEAQGNEAGVDIGQGLGATGMPEVRLRELTCMLLLWFMKSTTGHMAYHLTFWDSTRSYSRLNMAAAMAPFSTYTAAGTLCDDSMQPHGMAQAEHS